MYLRSRSLDESEVLGTFFGARSRSAWRMARTRRFSRLSGWGVPRSVLRLVKAEERKKKKKEKEEKKIKKEKSKATSLVVS